MRGEIRSGTFKSPGYERDEFNERRVDGPCPFGVLTRMSGSKGRFGGSRPRRLRDAPVVSGG